MNVTELDSVYRDYGFEVQKLAEDIRAYLKKSGYFHNADVVPLRDISQEVIKKTKDDLDKAGYAATVREYNSVEEAENQLFRGFFAAESNRQRLLNEYSKFDQSVSNSIGSEYSYVSVDYETRRAKNSDQGIVSLIHNILSRDEGCFIVLEAPAGFGKTCTTFEVLKAFLDADTEEVPILTRFALNRQAKIFRYVLLDEIDRNFPNLDSQLVQAKIREGKTPLLLDGFDELISRGEGLDDRYEDVESMLQTIGELLTNKAKILLTTRKTAIFSESEFESWKSHYTSNTDVHRIELQNPTVEDWLGPGRTETIEKQGLPLNGVANPVLLAFLRGKNDEEFKKLIRSGRVVDEYFDRMLEREMERQQIYLDVQEQKEIFRNLAQSMIRETYTADNKEYIQLRIHDQNRKLLEDARSLYSGENRPTTEELASKLSNHALLNRQGGTEDQVGFVNDFVQGTLVGDVVRSENSKTKDSLNQSRDPALFIDTAAVAYSSQNREKRKGLWEKLNRHIDRVRDTKKIEVDLRLRGKPKRKITDAYIEGLTIENCRVGDYPIKTTTFKNCKFRRVILLPNQISNVTFQNCRFEKLIVWTGNADQVQIHDCNSFGNTALHIKALSSNENFSYYNNNSGPLGDLEYIVLMNLYRQFTHCDETWLELNAFRDGPIPKEMDRLNQSAKRLSNRGVVTVDGERIKIVTSQISHIEVLLGERT